MRFLLVSFLALMACNSVTRRQDIESIENEIRVGRSLAAKLIKRYGLVRDDELTRYLNLVGRNIAANSSRPELTFYVGVLDTNEVNAFSCPGGYILITRGALLMMQNESQLAFVLAHEISHVALQHSGQFQRSGSLLDVVTGGLSGGSIVVNTAVRHATDQIEDQLLQKGRQRDLELDADKAGLVLAAQLGYDPYAATAYLTLVSLTLGSDAMLTRTHPAAYDRITAINQFIAENGYGIVNPALNLDRFQKNQQRLSKKEK